MKNLLYLLLIQLLSATISQAQNKPVNLYDSARVYYEKKDFKKAFNFYDTYYSDTTHGQSNYDTYYTAVAACLSGNIKKAAFYLGRSASIGYDLSSYNTFADDPLNICLRDLPEWKKFIEPFKAKADSAASALKAITDELNDSTKRINYTLLSNTAYWNKLAEKSSPDQLLKAIQQFNNYPGLKNTGHWTLYYQKVNDSLRAPFLCYIPKNYKPNQKSALYIFMHGGVSGPKNFGNPAYEPNSEKELFKRAFEKNAFIIFPFARKTFNWLQHQDAFETILSEIAKVKSLYNIDDNKVYVGGHSDGGRGAVWFAMNQATPFAAFYGICYFPSIYTGNTFLRNLHNQFPFYGISATKDNLFPVATVKSIIDYDKKEGGNWKVFEVEGTHGLPYRTPDSIYFVFDSLLTNTRNPVPKKLTWETDNIKNGRYFWLAINELDTVSTPASWHTPLNPQVVNKEGKLGKINFSKHKAGAVMSIVSNNKITINTSCVKELTIYLTAGLVDIKKPVVVFINGVQKFKGIVKANKSIMMSEFLKTKDRVMVPLNKLTFRL